MEIATRHPCRTYNFEMGPRFLENLWHPSVKNVSVLRAASFVYVLYLKLLEIKVKVILYFCCAVI